MKPVWKGILLLALAAIVGCWLLVRLANDWEAAAIKVTTVSRAPSSPGPLLLKARTPTPEYPLQSWERLLAEDGTPTEDRAALADVVRNYLEAIPADQRPALGTNEEITRALSDGEDLGKSAIPPTHPAILGGELVDRWGSPWSFHPLSANVIEVRSAGPDRKLFTGDDIVR